MRRRDFISLVGGAAATWPHAARAQTDTVRRIGILVGVTMNEIQKDIVATLQGLGWIDGRNVRIDYRTTAGGAERTRANAAELVRLSPDAILVAGAVATRALQNMTGTVPIVFWNVADPVAGGFVASLAHPGGNMTGFSNFEFSIGRKWLEVLKEIAPRIARIAVVSDPDNVNQVRYARSIAAAAPSFAVEVMAASVRNAAEIETAIAALGREPGGALIVLPSTVAAVNGDLIVELAARYRLPAIYSDRTFVLQGGLISYGPDLIDMSRRATSYVDRILRGEKPGDLPVQQPTKFELIINLKTAKALSLTVPLALQASADEVIE